MFIDRLLGSTTAPLLERTAAFTERRQDVLAGNIANISTPGYKTRDLPVQQFQAALKEAALRSQTPGNSTAETAAWSFSQPLNPDTLAELFPDSMYQAGTAKPATPTFQDGNNRGVETELMELTKNQMLQSMAIELMTAQLNRLQMVVSERV